MKTAVLSAKGLWEKTSVQCLLRHRGSGRYYGRFTLHGKQKWITLDTDVFAVAKLRLADEAARIGRQRGAVVHVEAGKATVGELMEIYRERIRGNPDFKPRSIESRLTGVRKLQKTWPDIDVLEPKQITPAAIFSWVSRFKSEGTGFVAPGAKTVRKGNSATSVNLAIDTLRALLDIAIERGQIHANPVLVRPPTGRLKKKVTAKKLILPSMAEVEKLIVGIENNGAIGGWGIEAADFCRFLMMSGVRVGEVSLITWSCVDWERQQLRIPGTKTETSYRFIPLFSELKALLKKIIGRRQAAARFAPNGEALIQPVDPIFRIGECQKSIDAACRKCGIQRITHHDFRHLFATICIESGVDIPTVAGWLGHSDGGVLAMKTYGHLRLEHSQWSARKVKFKKPSHRALVA